MEEKKIGTPLVTCGPGIDTCFRNTCLFKRDFLSIAIVPIRLKVEGDLPSGTQMAKKEWH